MNPFLRYLADQNSARTHTHTQTDRHTPLTTRPDGLRRAGNKKPDLDPAEVKNYGADIELDRSVEAAGEAGRSVGS